MVVVRLLLAMLAGVVGRDVVHRARAIERHQRDDVLEPVRPHAHQGLAHALAFQLEHADRLAARQHVVARPVVERDGGEVDVDAALGDQLHRRRQRRQRLEAEEVELHQARALDPFHVELGDGHGGTRIAIERHQRVEAPVADHDAGGVGRGVAIEALQLLRHAEQLGDRRILVARLAQARLVLDRLRQRDRVGRVLRHHLAEPVDLAIGHLQHAADVAQHGARLQRTEGDDLRDLGGAILVLDVVDDLAAPVLAEVDVEVRHRDALGIEEALEQQREPHRVEVGDGQRPGDERARARTSARADRNALRLRPLDEVGDDQEVAGELHALDDRELEFEPVPVVLVREPRRQAVEGEPLLQAARRVVAQRRDLGPLGRLGLGIGTGEARQDRLPLHRPIGAAQRDLDRIVGRLRQVGEQLDHLGARLEIVLRRQPPPLVVGDHGTLGNRDERVMRLIVAALREERLVGRHQRQAMAVGEVDQLRLGPLLLDQMVTL